MNLEKLCQDVCELSRRTGEFIRTERKTFSVSAIEHKGPNDLVSYVDKTSEQQLVAGLQALLPEAGFITEENTLSTAGKNFQWIIDPLDGTTNFVHGVPCYCISIALAQGEELLLGVIYEINLNECFSAWKNGGAFLNGKKISVSAISRLNDSLIATGFPYTNYERLKPYMRVFDYCMHHTHGIRRLGSAAADLAYVACGRFECFYEYGLNAWDVAAGCILVTEAGGRVSDFSGEKNFVFGKEIIAANAATHREFLEVVRKEF